MRTLIVYFSGSGNNKRVAEKLADLIKADIERLDDGQRRCFFRDGFQAATQKTVAIKQLTKDLDYYDDIVLVTPVWAGNLPAAVRTFLLNYKDRLLGKRVWLASCSGSGEDNKEIVNKAIKCLSKDFEAALLLSDAELKKAKADQKLQDFAALIARPPSC
ncbi:hypothetical protein HPY42_00395 [Coprothermobacteraceae bacterium]|nr:hypothetical protein [Coprothermobacteraceae bacterium]